MAIDYVRNIISSGYNLAKINDNFAKIQTSLQDAISRGGDGPNQMNADFDMNSNDILNVGIIDAETFILNGQIIVPGDELSPLPALVMTKPVYDPQGIEADVFDRANHTGPNVPTADSVGPDALDDTQIAELRDKLGLDFGPISNMHVTPVLVDYDHHYGLNTVLFNRTDNGLTFVTRQAPRHTGDVDATIVAWETYDQGLTRQNMRTIYEGASTDDRNFAANTMGTRFGLVAYRPGEVPMFLYNDSQGVGTWPAIPFTIDGTMPVGFAASPHGKINRYPASVGGHDTLGWIAYFYGSEVIGSSVTLNNGDTWSPITLAVSGVGQNPNEFAIDRVGTEDKWYCVSRVEVPGSKALVAVSTDARNFGPLTESNVVLSTNPPYIVHDDDNVSWLYTTIRQGASEISGNPPNVVAVSKLNSSLFYSSKGLQGFGPWKVVAQLSHWGTGYMDFTKYNGEWIAAINAGELSQGGSATNGACGVYLLSSLPSSQGLSILQAVSQKSTLLNSSFQVWQSGPSGVGAAGRVLTADGWGLRRAGSALGVSWSRQPGENGGYCLRIQRDAGNTSTALINVINVMDKEDVRALRGRTCNVPVLARRGDDYSELNSQLFVDVYYATTEAPVNTTDGTLPGGIALKQYPMTLSGAGYFVEGAGTFLVPDDAEMIWFRARYTPVGTAGAADYFELDEAHIQPTPYKTRISRRSYGEELALCQRQFCKTYNSETVVGNSPNTVGALQDRARGTEATAGISMQWKFPVEMRAVPAVTPYSTETGVASRIRDITGAVDVLATTECVGKTGCAIIPSAATVSGNRYRAHAAATALPW